MKNTLRYPIAYVMQITLLIRLIDFIHIKYFHIYAQSLKNGLTFIGSFTTVGSAFLISKKDLLTEALLLKTIDIRVILISTLYNNIITKKPWSSKASLSFIVDSMSPSHLFLLDIPYLDH